MQSRTRNALLCGLFAACMTLQGCEELNDQTWIKLTPIKKMCGEYVGNEMHKLNIASQKTLVVECDKLTGSEGNEDTECKKAAGELEKAITNKEFVKKFTQTCVANVSAVHDYTQGDPQVEASKTKALMKKYEEGEGAALMLKTSKLFDAIVKKFTNVGEKIEAPNAADFAALTTPRDEAPDVPEVKAPIAAEVAAEVAAIVSSTSNEPGRLFELTPALGQPSKEGIQYMPIFLTFCVSAALNIMAVTVWLRRSRVSTPSKEEDPETASFE